MTNGKESKALFVGSSILASFCASAFETCNYGASQCSPETFCVQVDKDKSECRPLHKDLITVILPFPKHVRVTCDQGSLTARGNSHTWANTAFALDLQTSPKNSNANVTAVFDGIVAAFSECKTENDQCGMGFGNQVKIFSNDGYVAFYAHLKKTHLKTGDRIKKGEVVGIEGTTGWTGEGNKHLHFSLHYDWRPEGFDYWKPAGFLPASVPFKLSFCEGCSEGRRIPREVDIRSLACRRTHSQVAVLCAR